MYNYENDDEKDIINNINQNKDDLMPTDIELEQNIEILQNAINLVKTQRKQLEKETEIINKRIIYLKQKEKQIKMHCKKQIDQIHRAVEIKKKRLQDEILIEQKKNNTLTKLKNKNSSKNSNDI